jgi:hypothetical protein
MTKFTIPHDAWIFIGDGQKAFMGVTDWHELEKHRFVRRVAAVMEQLIRDRPGAGDCCATTNPR